MSYVDDVRGAPSPKAALAVIALALDELAARIAKLEAGDDWDSWGDPVWVMPGLDAEMPHELIGDDGLTDSQRAEHHRALLAMSNTEPREFVLPTPTPEKMEQRRMLERQALHLALALGSDAGDVDWTEAYAKGGPWWLYQERRDLVMSYDYTIRQRMVADVEQDAPKLAYEMSLDVLKHGAGEPDLETGAGALAVSDLTSAKVKR